MASKNPRTEQPAIGGAADLWDTSAGSILAGEYFDTSAMAVQPLADDWDWDWDETLPTDLVVTGYQQADAPVVVPPAQQADAEWNWDEALQPELVVTGYQNADAPVAASPLLCASHEWDWNEVLQPELVVTGFQNANFTPAASPAQQPQEDWDFASDFGGEDGWSNHFTNYDVSRNLDQDWDWNEYPLPEFQVLGYQQSDAVQAPSVPRQPGDAEWDWDEALHSELVVTGYQNANAVVVVNPLLCSSHEWDWNEVLQPELVVTGFQNANFTPAASPAQQPQEDWDFASDFGGEDGWSNHFTNYDAPARYELDWDWSADIADEWIVDQTLPSAVVVAPANAPTADAWDWHEQVSDDLCDADIGGQLGADVPVVPVVIVQGALYATRAQANTSRAPSTGGSRPANLSKATR